ncbi:hypothetical protein GGX14DRAFT_641680 [Mycena pura]|uniref:P-loop containing nucleoside triphosphate hydrolase protein n=1 Tax=Mycena pura TaxID=153505 RepID=A0AAD6YPZ8_9AGAR|nr:hypothetical protein GGX14DRAFT_641680 [Mycena pura]
MDLENFEEEQPLPQQPVHVTSSRGALTAIDNVFYTPASRAARWMDLIGDYGGKELFVVEGESLLQNVMYHPALAIGREREPETQRIDNSFQLLHAKFLLEKAILEFTSRDASFEIVFFECCKHSTVLTGEAHFVSASRALARKLLIQHVKTLNIQVHVFEDTDDPRWNIYLATVQINTFVFESASVAQRANLGEPIIQQITTAKAYLNKTLAHLVPLPTSSTIPYIEDPDGVESTLHAVFRVHLDILPSIPVSYRARKLPILHPELEEHLHEQFLPRVFQEMAASTTASPEVDGRIFLELLAFALKSLPLGSGSPPFRLYDVDLTALSRRYPVLPVMPPKAMLPSEEYHLQAFKHPVFDQVLGSVAHPSSASANTSPTLSIFGDGILVEDVRHWHNNRPILPTYLGGQRPQPATAWEKMKREKREQRDHARLQKQAASLIGASGGVLTKVLIPPVKSFKYVHKCMDGKPKKRAGADKADKKSAGTEKARAKIIAEKEVTEGSEAKKWWVAKLRGLQAMASVDAELEALLALKRSSSPKVFNPAVVVELRLYHIHLIFKRWSLMDDGGAETARDAIVVEVLRGLMDLRRVASAGVGEDAHDFLSTVCETIGFAEYTASLVSHKASPDVALAFKPLKLIRKKKLVFDFMRITIHPIDWQLQHYGEFMDRSMDSAPDARVSFAPDRWQREVLNAIDHGKSILALAPTSAGKTFISFYAMEKVLRESDNGVLVYVAPTKALVNQIAAEVYGRFSKNYSGNGTLFAVQTRDTRTGDIQRAQILITVPEMLGILILSPTLANNWTSRIKRIILDEIHSIGQDEGGAVWEQIILLAPCPVIGLSATVGSPEGFNKWLQSVQHEHGFKHEFVHHPHRYSHLRKFLYLLSEDAPSFTGLHTHRTTGRMTFMHPLSLLSEHARNLPSDLALEARDCFSLYHVLKDLRLVQDDALSPTIFFSGITDLLRQADILRYEAQLKAVVSHAIQSASVTRAITAALAPNSPNRQDSSLSKDGFKNNLLIMLSDLHMEDKLAYSQVLQPAILFSFDRTNCEVMAKTLVKSLAEAEDIWKEQSVEWKRKLKRVEEWRRNAPLREKQREKEERQLKDKDAFREGVSLPWEATFDEDEPLPNFSFVGRASSKEEVAEIIDGLTKPWMGTTPPWAIAALKRGIAVHHAGMNKAYRVAIESLFREGFIRVMISTGTLALGINAPAKTSVFCGDSPYLTALMYRQCAGRAGRRGYDLLGNVVFYGLNYGRVQRLILSRLPSLGDSFPLTSTLILRLFNLLAGSNDSNFAVSAIRSILNLPRISHRSEMGRDQVLHHVRFSIDYLRYSGLLNDVASHLYYAEPSNFALVRLFEDGVIHRICNGPSIIDAQEQMLLILCHLFGRRFIPCSYLSSQNMTKLRMYPSLIVLPPLPELAATVLQKHDKKVLEIFSSYAKSYARSHRDTLGLDNALPLSGVCEATPPLQLEAEFLDHLRTTSLCPTTRSVFAASSGLDDAFASVTDLVSTVRKGIHLHEHAIPTMQDIIAHAEPDLASRGHALNAYIFDFYMHGQLETLSIANGIRRGEVWYLLQAFELVLKAIRTCLQEMLVALSKARGAEVDEENLQSVADEALELEEDEDDLDGKFRRPPKTKDQDWRVYQVVATVLENFEEKYRKIFA